MASRKNLLPDEQISEIVYNDVRWAREFRRHFQDNWLRFYSLYKNYIDEATYPFQAQLAIPTAYTLVEVQVAFLTDMIFEAGNFVEVLGKTPEGQASARAVGDLLDYHFRNSFDIYEDMDMFIRQLLMYGTSIYKVFWKYRPGYKTQPRLVFDQDGEVKGFTREPAPIILENKPYGYTVDLAHFGVDPNASSIPDARFAFEELWVDPIELREKEQLDIGYKNVDAAIQLAHNTNWGLQERYNKLNIPHVQGDPTFTQNNRGKVHLIDYWGYLTRGWESGTLKKSAKTMLYHVVLALPGAHETGDANPVVVFAEPSPFAHNRIPYIDARINATVGEFYGTGDIEYCESLLLEQRDMRNIQMDNLSMAMNKMFLVNRNGQIDDGELVWRPSGIIHVTNPTDVTLLDNRPITPDAFRAQEDIRRDIEQVTSVSDFTMGQYRSSTGFNDTATGISLIQQTALKRMAKKGQIVQRSIRDIGEMTFSLIGQYEPFGSSFRVLDREATTMYRFVDLSPDALSKNYDFHIVSAPALGSKPIRVNQMIQLLQILIQAKQIDPNFQFELPRLVKRIVQEMEIPNSQEIFGFQEFQRNMPQGLGPPEGMDQLIPPQEENRMMVEGNVQIMPKTEENHPYHMMHHQAQYENLPEGSPARQLLKRHYSVHASMAEQTRETMAQAMQLEQSVSGANQLEQRMNLTKTNNAKSPTGAGGQEDITRIMGGLMSGNA